MEEIKAKINESKKNIKKCTETSHIQLVFYLILASLKRRKCHLYNPFQTIKSWSFFMKLMQLCFLTLKNYPNTFNDLSALLIFFIQLSRYFSSFFSLSFNIVVNNVAPPTLMLTRNAFCALIA